MNEENRTFDVILWGATGFTGQLVAEYLFKNHGVDGDLKWAIAGRGIDKLDQVAKQIAGNQASEVKCLIANSDDATSIAELAKQTRVICSTVGPYALYGTVMVEACAENGTHYCDLTGEVHWMRDMIDTYQSLAESTGARIVHTCGFDSIPSDMGVYYLQKMMHEKQGVFASEVKFRVVNMQGGASGGTVASMMNMMEEADRNPAIRDVLADPYGLNPQNMPRGVDGPDQTAPLFDLDFKQWTAPFVMAGINTRVVRRTHALQDYRYGDDFRYSEAMLMGNGPAGYVKAALVAGMSGFVMLTAAFSSTRSLLAKVVPKPGEGPTPEAIENGFFDIELFGKHPDDRARSIKVRVTGDKDPGYGATSKMLAESAICLAKDDLDVPGGFLTPAAAMGDRLLTRLQENAGMTFSVI